MARDRDLAITLIKDKLDGKTTLNYKEIAELSDFHPKYILKLKKEILDGTISLVHGNKNRKPINAISEEEEMQIVNLYQRSHASIKKFAKFYGKRSYSCIYSVLKKHNLI
ncbi:MAG: hypothetical protein IJ565_01475 [Bacilli bacterium]|nr:hypothetical protein [Bacilli bacterium]